MTVEQLDKTPLLPADDGVRLLHSYLAALAEFRFHKQRVDEWVNEPGDTIRHHYHAGTWELRITPADGPPATLKYSRDAHAYPTVDVLVSDTIKVLWPEPPHPSTTRRSSRG